VVPVDWRSWSRRDADVRYESEIARLRRELEARGGAGVAEPPEGSKPTEYERSMYPPALGAPPLNGDSSMFISHLFSIPH
jgi:hypothetical protein